MSFQFRDIRIAQLENAGPSITFNGQIVPPLPTGETLTYARAGVNAIAGPSSVGNAWLYRHGLWRQLNSAYGNFYGAWAVVLDESYVAWQEIGAGVVRQPLDGGPVELLSIQPQATGLLDILSGVPRPDDRSQPFSFTWQGENFQGQLWMTRAGRTVMQANNMPGGSGVVVWDANTSQLWRVFSGDLQIPPRISEDGRIVALTGDITPGFVDEALWNLEPSLPPINQIQQKMSPVIFGAFTR